MPHFKPTTEHIYRYSFEHFFIVHFFFLFFFSIRIRTQTSTLRSSIINLEFEIGIEVRGWSKLIRIALVCLIRIIIIYQNHPTIKWTKTNDFICVRCCRPLFLLLSIVDCRWCRFRCGCYSCISLISFYTKKERERERGTGN